MLPVASILVNNKDNMGIAIVTSGNRIGAQAILRATGLDTSVDVLVSGNDVKDGKPAPEPYLLGLKKLGTIARRAIAFEDHDDGILSATLAGLLTIDVRSSVLVAPRPK